MTGTERYAVSTGGTGRECGAELGNQLGRRTGLGVGGPGGSPRWGRASSEGEKERSEPRGTWAGGSWGKEQEVPGALQEGIRRAVPRALAFAGSRRARCGAEERGGRLSWGAVSPACVWRTDCYRSTQGSGRSGLGAAVEQ